MDCIIVLTLVSGSYSYFNLFFNQQRLKTDEYEDVETFSHDMCLLLENAIKFYQSDLQEHKDAVKLQGVFANAKAQLCAHLNEQGLYQSYLWQFASAVKKLSPLCPLFLVYIH